MMGMCYLDRWSVPRGLTRDQKRAFIISKGGVTMAEYKLIVAGGRNFNDKQLLIDTMDSYWDIYGHSLSIVSGMASGADRMGLEWAKAQGMRWYEFPAAWDNTEAPGAVVKTNRHGKKYNVLAGHNRNKDMAEFGDALLLFWDGKSSGSKNMLETVVKLEKPYQIIYY